MMILSMDLGKFKTVCCLYDTETRKYRFETIATCRSHLDHLLDSHQADLVVMEACGPSVWISDVCKQRGLQTIVCSTNDDAWSWKNTKRKTDRDDTLKLAKMAVLEARKIAVVAWAMMRDETDYGPKKLMPEVPAEESIIHVKRREVRPAGELHCEKPKHPASRGSTKPNRRGSPRRPPSKNRAPVTT